MSGAQMAAYDHTKHLCKEYNAPFGLGAWSGLEDAPSRTCGSAG